MGKALAVLNLFNEQICSFQSVYIPQTTTKQQQQQKTKQTKKQSNIKKQTKQNKNMEICLRNINLIFSRYFHFN